MSAPIQIGHQLQQEEWHKVRLDAIFKCCKWDIQAEDHCVLAEFPLVIEHSEWAWLCEAAERLASEAAHAEIELTQRPDLHAQLGIPSKIRWEMVHVDSPPPTSTRVIRFDFHLTETGWKISEMNGDVPGGFIEASGFTKLMAAYYPALYAPPSPADIYADSIAGGQTKTVAMVHATAYKDDRQVMEFLGRRLSERGCRTVMVSPVNLRWKSGVARFHESFGDAEVDEIVRFYPAEWLANISGEALRSYFHGSRTPISNPATALLVQSKRFPLVWDSLASDLRTWRSLLPETRSITDLDKRDLAEWVIKPIFGRVGDGVAIEGVTPPHLYKKIVRAAKRRSGEWIAQKKFQAVAIRSEHGDLYPSIGVFTINGLAAGAYGRVGRKPLIDHEAQDVAVLISEGGRA